MRMFSTTLILLLGFLELVTGFHTHISSSSLSAQNKTLSLSSEQNRTLSMPSEGKEAPSLYKKSEAPLHFLPTNISHDSNHALQRNARSFSLNRTNLNNVPLNSHNITTLHDVPIRITDSQLLVIRALDFDLFDIRLFDSNDLLFQVLNTSEGNESFEIPTVTINNTSEYNETGGASESSYYLTRYFKCNMDQTDDVSISCKNVSIYDVAKYLPNDTASLEITNSPTMKLLKRLSTSLKKLKYLRLSNNEHRYITRAFVGLENLEHLDLSDNNIMAVKNAFSYLSNLKYLNLSKNSFITIEVVANALEGLKHLEILVLDHNWRIFRIRKNELKPLSNSNITKLHLFNTTMSIAERGAFEHLTKLEVLDLSVNYLNEEALTNVTSSLKNAPIRYLFLQEWVHLNVFPSESLKFLENTPINRIDLSHNYFIEVHKVPYIPSLQSLWLTHCAVKFIDHDVISQLPNLTELVLSNNDLVHYDISSSKSLKTLILSDQASRFKTVELTLSDFGFKNTSNLEIIDLSSNLLPRTLHRFVLFGLKNLRALSLKSAGLINIEDYAFETLSSLNTLNLQINNIKYLSNATLFGLHKLTNLYLSYNLLTLMDWGNPFQSTPSLVNLLLDNNRIENLPKDMFAFTDHLELLILLRNKISPWDEPILGENSTVSTFALSQNNIDYATPTMLSEFRKITGFLDIGRNPFNCSKCGMKNFQNFLNSTHIQMGLPLRINQEKISVKCMLPNKLQGQPLVEVDLPFTDCTEQEELVNVFTIVLICLLSLFVAVMAYTCYTFRWYIRYWVFHIKSEVKERRSSNSKHERTYKYDAFVSYNSSDTPWIVSFLIPALENQDPKLKLCIHDRDFKVGWLITDNILDAIENSRKVILILTEEFVKSEWCMFELHMAQHRLFDETRDSLVLIKLKQVDKKFYTKNLKYLEKTRTCLLWPDNLPDQKLFWLKVRKLLGHPHLQSESEVMGLEQYRSINKI